MEYPIQHIWLGNRIVFYGELPLISQRDMKTKPLGQQIPGVNVMDVSIQ